MPANGDSLSWDATAAGTLADPNGVWGPTRWWWNEIQGIDPIYRFFDHFDGYNFKHVWRVGGGPPALADLEKGICQVPFAGGVDGHLYGSNCNYYRAANPIFETYVMADVITQNINIAYETSALAGVGFGCRFAPATSANWMLWNNNGGGVVDTASATPVVAGQWYLIRFWLSGAVGAQTCNLLIDGTDLTTYNAAQPVATRLEPHYYTQNGGAGGTYLNIDWCGLAADFSQAPA